MSAPISEVGVSETLYKLAALECLADLREDALRPLADAFKAESLVAFRQRMDGPAHCLRPIATVNQTGDVVRHYLQKVSPHDPCMPYWRSVALKSQSVWQYSDVLHASAQNQARRFERFLSERANVSHMLMMSLNIGACGNDSMLFALHRAPGRPDFSRSEREAAVNFAPLFRQIVRGLAASDVEHHVSSVARSVLDRDADAAQVLVDLETTVLCGDAAAKDFIYGLPASQRATLKAKLTALRERLLADGLGAQSVSVGSLAGRDLSALAIDDGAKQFVVTITRAHPSDTCVFSALTPRQMQVAELVASGCRNWQVAQLLGISENTVVNHLAAIYEALAIGGRIELALMWKTNQKPN
ncbi:MAG: helix-turn-helix transcriptional regulator [Pseudomonadota bacterium]